MSETVTHDLTVWEMMSQLVAPEGILVKNEIYHETMSNLFDRTMLIYYEHVPIVKSWALSIGSNRMDLLQPNITSMKKWDKIKTVWDGFNPTPKDFDDHFKYVHDYQINNAQDTGKCLDAKQPPTREDDKRKKEMQKDKDEALAGILLILEAEKTSESIEVETISLAMKEVGLTPISTISHVLQDGKSLAIIFLREGLVTARTWPEENYCAFDVQLWSAFSKIESIKSGLSKVTGSKQEHVSSYRIITGGVASTEMLSEDKKKIGPRNESSRECNTPVIKDGDIDGQIIEAVMEEIMEMIQEESGAVAVLCGSRDEPCLSNNILLKKRSSLKSVPLWTCPHMLSTVDLKYEKSYKTQMFKCEMELLYQLRDAVSQNGKFLAFVLDSSSNLNMGILAHRILANPKNKPLLLTDRFTFIVPIKNDVDKYTNKSIPQMDMDSKVLNWRHSFLEWRRRELVDYQFLFRAEVTLQGTNGLFSLGILSGQDPHFFSRLVNVTKTIELQTGLITEIQKIEGGIEEFSAYQEEKWYTEDDFASDRKAGEAQFAAQRPLAEQRLYQFNVLSGEITSFVLRAFVSEILAKHTSLKVHVLEDIGIGYILGALSSEGSIVLVWDGMKHIDLNIFGYETETSSQLEGKFEKYALTYDVKLEMMAYDEFPRGVERVVNIRQDLEVWRNLSNEL
uniref:Uncharacterized protein n=1 Tax=Corethron hystrix TaxID=216773 RepID=A0A7S1BKL3_9STRA